MKSTDVSETTKFNETYLLKGDAASNGNKKTFAANDVLGTVDGLTVAAKGGTANELTDGAQIKIGTVDVVPVMLLILRLLISLMLRTLLRLLLMEQTQPLH